jgi:hypothetical protein
MIQKSHQALVPDGRPSVVRFMLVGVITVSIFMYLWLHDSYRREVKLSSELYAELSSTVVGSSEDKNADCIFRDSSIYRKVFVYPSPNEPEWADASRAESSQIMAVTYRP